MDTLVHLGLINAALATVLALLAAAARCVCRRPAVAHALWLLVLLKLLTPPFVPVPISWLPRPATNHVPSTQTVLPSAEWLDEEVRSLALAPTVPTELPQPFERSAGSDRTPTPRADVGSRTADMTVAPPSAALDKGGASVSAILEWPSWEFMLGAIWLTGSLLWWAVAIVRLYGFRKSLRLAQPA